MIRYSKIIEKIRADVPLFENRVGGSVAYGMASASSANIAMPHAFVMPVDFKDQSILQYDESFPDEFKTKVIKEVFSIIVCLDNRDNRGIQGGGLQEHIPLDQLDVFQQALELAFSGWKPEGLPPKAGAITIDGGRFIDSNNAQLWWGFDFAVVYRSNPLSLSTELEAEINSLTEDNEEDWENIRTAKHVIFRDTLVNVSGDTLRDDFKLDEGVIRTEPEREAMEASADFIHDMSEDDAPPTPEELEVLIPHIPDPSVIRTKGVAVYEPEKTDT